MTADAPCPLCAAGEAPCAPCAFAASKPDDCICVIQGNTAKLISKCEPCRLREAEARRVVSIFDRAPISDTVNNEEDAQYQEMMIAQMEDLLTDMRNGAFKGFAMALVGADSLPSTVCSDHVALAPFMYLGGLSRLAHRINAEQDATREEQEYIDED